MKVNDFDFNLPETLIAFYPLAKRSASRLLNLQRSSGSIDHKKISQLPELLKPNDLLVFNDTRVIPARIFAAKTTGGKIELLIERILFNDSFLAHAKPGRSLKPGMKIFVLPNYDIEIIQQQDSLWHCKFQDAQPILEILQKIGHIPLPPYIKRNDEELDKERYQTVFAARPGAVAAPTAGLHFDEELLQQIREREVDVGFVTLHVGAGTFKPVKVENILAHKMHSEYFEVSEKLCEQIRTCKEKNGRVIAAGTTVVRGLETMAATGDLKPFAGETTIFIYPGFQFRCVNGMITNFHLPKSTLLMLVCAFAGREKILHAYQEAIAQQYRFFSYGDAMFII
jgi:S-adenosylmethionine:tRNA ribosyltransferase-isomerase